MRRISLMMATLATALLSANALGQTLDPVFANSFESGLIGFGPPLSAVAVGQSNIATAYTPLQVTLSDPAVAPTFVAITSSDPSRLSVSAGGVTVATGQSSATVLVNGLLSSTTPVTLWAKLGNTLGASVRVEQALNETGPPEADFCSVQFPTAFSVLAGVAAPTVYGRLYVAGVTDPVGAPVGWAAQFGHGAQASDPRLLSGWQFFDATYNTQFGNDDEFQTSFNAPLIPGIYSYTYRFSGDGGGSWTYCDTDGAGSGTALTFDSAMLGQMTVNDPYAGLVINEVDYDTVGSPDNAEFIEVYNGGSLTMDLSTLALAMINGTGNTEYARYNLVNAGSIAPGQYLVVKSSAVSVPAGALTLAFPAETNQIQNGAPDGVALIDTASQRILDALSYEGSVTAAAINGFPGTYTLVEGTALLAADDNTTNGSLARLPNGTDTNNAVADWNFTASSTPGAANVLTP